MQSVGVLSDSLPCSASSTQTLLSQLQVFTPVSGEERDEKIVQEIFTASAWKSPTSLPLPLATTGHMSSYYRVLGKCRLFFFGMLRETCNFYHVNY